MTTSTSRKILSPGRSYSCHRVGASVLFDTELANEPELVNEPELANEPDLANEPELVSELELANSMSWTGSLVSTVSYWAPFKVIVKILSFFHENN